MPLVLMMVLVAATALMLNRQSAVNVAAVESAAEAAMAQYAAEAGLNHAIWQANQANCSNYQNVPATPFGADSYAATVTPISGSPITIAATGTSAGGTTRSLTRTPVSVFEPTISTLSLKPDGIDGKDTVLFQPQPNRNYGSFPGLMVDFGTEHSLVEFSVASIPSSALIVTARLRLWVADVFTAGEVEAYGITRSWNEGTGSADPCVSGATWFDVDCWSGWTTDGGDADTDPSAKSSVTAAGAWIEFDLTDLTQAWVSGERPNYGVLLKSTGSANTKFISSDAGSTADHPEFIVTYACECGTSGGSFSETLRPGSTGEDTYIDDGSPSTNFGEQNDIRLSNKTNSQKRGLVKFDLATVPPDANVTSATLQLNLEGIGSGGVASVDVHRATTSWAELQANWNNATSSTPWTSPGGDWDPAVEDTAVIDDLAPGPTTWDLTNLVAAWLDGTYANDGVFLLSSAGVNHADFTTSDDSNPSVRPQLTIDYTCPCSGCSGPPPAPPQTILLVVPDAASPDPQDTVKKTLMEAWGFTVALISADAAQADFDTAAGSADVAYVSEKINSSDLGTKLRDTTIGVVIEENAIVDEFGIASGNTTFTEDTIDITDNAHYITSPFGLGALAFATSPQAVGAPSGTLAPELEVLAQRPSGSLGTITFIEKGGMLYDSGTAAGRRVKLPWGGNGFDINSLTLDGQAIMRRAIEWGAGAEPAAQETVLMVVSNAAALTTEEVVTKALIESWAYAVDLIDDDDTQANFNIAVTDADVAFITADVNNSALGVKLTDTTIGVVNEEHQAWGELELCGNAKPVSNTTTMDIRDNSHYITAPFPIGPLTILTLGADSMYCDTSPAAGSVPLIESQNGNPGLLTLDTGALRLDGQPSTGRRVTTAWGGNWDPSKLNSQGQQVLKRSLQWATGSGGDGGGGGGPTGIVFEEFTEAKATAATAVSIDKPAGTADGNLLIATLVTDGSTSGSMTPPPGWTVIDLAEQAGNVTFGVWWKLAGASEPASYSFSWNSGEKVYGTVMRFTGHDPATPIDVASSAGGSSSTPNSPAVTTTVADTMILRLGGFDDDDITVDAPGLAGHTAITMDESSSGNGTSSSGAGYVMQPAAGDSSTSTFTLTNTEEYRAVTIAIAPPP